jgi:hypothetical protein
LYKKNIRQDLQDRLDRRAFGRRTSRLPQAKKILLILLAGSKLSAKTIGPGRCAPKTGKSCLKKGIKNRIHSTPSIFVVKKYAGEYVTVIMNKSTKVYQSREIQPAPLHAYVRLLFSKGRGFACEYFSYTYPKAPGGALREAGGSPKPRHFLWPAPGSWRQE